MLYTLKLCYSEFKKTAAFARFSRVLSTINSKILYIRKSVIFYLSRENYSLFVEAVSKVKLIVNYNCDSGLAVIVCYLSFWHSNIKVLK